MWCREIGTRAKLIPQHRFTGIQQMFFFLSIARKHVELYFTRKMCENRYTSNSLHWYFTCRIERLSYLQRVPNMKFICENKRVKGFCSSIWHRVKKDVVR